MKLDLDQLVWNQFGLQYLKCGLATHRRQVASTLTSWNRFSFRTLVVDWPHRRKIAPSWASWNRFCLRTLVMDWPNRRQVAPSWASWNRISFSTLVVDWPHRRQVAPSWATWNWFCSLYLSCGLATQETGGSFLSQLEPVLLTVSWLWTGHTGDKWLLPEPVGTGSAQIQWKRSVYKNSCWSFLGIVRSDFFYQVGHRSEQGRSIWPNL